MDIESLRGQSLPYKLQRLRWWKKISQEQLAKAINGNAPSISNWERGLTYPRTYMLERLRLFYNLPQDFFLEDEIKIVKFRKNYRNKPDGE